MSSLTRLFRLTRTRPRPHPYLFGENEACVASFQLTTPGETSRQPWTPPLYFPLPRSQQWSARSRSFSGNNGPPAEQGKAPPPRGTTPTEDDANTTPEYAIPGAQAGGKKLAIVYTCKVCDTRSIKQFSEHSYQNGVVLVRCPGCQNLHLIADRMGIFEGGGDWDIEKAMAQLGERVNVINDDNVLEMTVEDLVGKDAIEALTSSEGSSVDDGKVEEKKL